MPRPLRRTGYLDDVVALLGPLPLSAGELPHKVVITTLNAYRRGLSTIPPHDISVMMLALAGLASAGFISTVGQIANGDRLELQGGPASRKHRTLFVKVRDLIEGVVQEEPVTFEEMKKFETYVKWGLETYGYTPASPARRGPRVKQFTSLNHVQWQIAWHYRDFQSGRLKVSDIIRDRAEWEALFVPRMRLQKEGKDPNLAVLTSGDAQEVYASFKRIEVAYYKVPRMSEQQVRGRRQFLACCARLSRRLRRNTNDFPNNLGD